MISYIPVKAYNMSIKLIFPLLMKAVHCRDKPKGE